jgi:aminopeptidase N
MPNQTVFLKDYCPANFSIDDVFLEFSLFDSHACVENRMTLRRQSPGDLRLSGQGLELIDIRLDEMPFANYTLDEEGLTIHTTLDLFILTIVTRFEPQHNTSLSGLYRSNTLFCTQCEAEGFRRMTYFLDRPDVLTIFTTKIIADKTKYPVLLSNGNWVDGQDLPDGRHWALWHDPFKKPCYLFALVAGDLACVRDRFETCSGREIDLRIYVEYGNEDKCAHAMHSLKKAMRWDEEHFGREYDLDLYMIVAVSDFNMGAMENKGLNIFNAKYILARPETATDIDYADIEGVVAHEYFHNWTGNRVTCRDWFQLSLKEGLTVFRDQEFSRDMNSRDVNRIIDVRVLKQTQFPEDAGRMAHPVRPDSYQEINNFYTTTIYNKGAEVIRMQATLLGQRGFRRGMDLYFERHDGQAVTIDDFVQAMSDANQRDMSQFMRWYTQAGTPHVRVLSESYEQGTLRVSFEQTCPVTPDKKEKEPFVIPIRYRLFDHYGEAINPSTDYFELTQAQQTFEIHGLKEKPLLSLFQDFSAPIVLERALSLDDLLLILRYDENGFVKWDVSQQLAQQVLHEMYQVHDVGALVDTRLLKTYQDILNNETLNQALRAELLTIPSFEILANTICEVDVERMECVRDGFKQQLSAALAHDARIIYNRLHRAEDHAMHGEAYARRRLKNMCLWLMMTYQAPEALSLCEAQFMQAQTMTDVLSSLGLLVNGSDQEKRAAALEHFYSQWKDNELVLDKWFSVQATSERPDTLSVVQSLLKHPKFVMTNPNKVRALIGAFCHANPRNFHAIDGSGYRFLTEMLLQMDSINAQVASSLATPFTRWQRYDKPRQQLMLKELERLSMHSLSKDLTEKVVKSLKIV